MDKCYETILKLVLPKLFIPNEGTDCAYAKEE